MAPASHSTAGLDAEPCGHLAISAGAEHGLQSTWCLMPGVLLAMAMAYRLWCVPRGHTQGCRGQPPP